MLSAALFTLVAASGALASSAANHAALAKRLESSENTSSLTKRATYSGRTTWYPTDTGPDACTGKNHLDSDWFIAMNMPQSGSCCGKQVHISYGGKSTVASCVDYCASCPQTGQIDLTKDLFKFFTNGDLDVGEITTTWYFTDGSGGGSSSGGSSGGGSSGGGNNDDDNDNNDDDDKETTTKKVQVAPKTTAKPKTTTKPTTTKKSTTKTSSSSKPTSSKVSSAKPSSSSAKPSKASSSSAPASTPTGDDTTTNGGVANVGTGAGSAAGDSSDDSQSSVPIAGALSGGTSAATSVLAKCNTFAAAGAVLALLAFQAF